MIYIATFVCTFSLSPWWWLQHSVEMSASYFLSSSWYQIIFLHLCRSQLRSHWKLLRWCCSQLLHYSTKVQPVLYTRLVAQWDGTGFFLSEPCLNFSGNATIYGHKMLFVKHLLSLAPCLRGTTFIGLNWYRLSFAASFILIGLTVACGKVVTTTLC